jgi:hypothetical protein
MRNRRHRHRTDPVAGLRVAIDCLPVATREAMLDGAYVDEHGGVCPMLAAHRGGARTNFLTFAKSWDRFARVTGKARPATPRELEILIGQLEGSLTSATGLELDQAISEHRRLRSSRMKRSRRALQGADPSGEIVARRLRRPRRKRIPGDNVAHRIEPRSLPPVTSRG